MVSALPLNGAREISFSLHPSIKGFSRALAPRAGFGASALARNQMSLLERIVSDPRGISRTEISVMRLA
jgi:hypothetical protein